ncbi:hypothetical protein PAMP_007338 [Pampus punctatissimus]
MLTMYRPIKERRRQLDTLKSTRISVKTKLNNNLTINRDEVTVVNVSSPFGPVSLSSGLVKLNCQVESIMANTRSLEDLDKMSDSDSDSDYSDCENNRHRMGVPHMRTHEMMKNDVIKPSDEVLERWSRVSVDVKKEAAQLMKLCTFWLPILLRNNELSSTACWAIEIGLIDQYDRENLSLKHLRKIETLEAILRALEKGSMKKEQTKHVILISNKFTMRSQGVLEDALQWLERTGEPFIHPHIQEFGHESTYVTALQHIFAEYSQYLREMGTNRSEEMKKRGNEKYEKKQYEEAVKLYSKAIKDLKAVGDGKRATLIKPLWAKGHYRYCEALFFLGEVKMAIEANKSAKSLCKDDQDGLKDLEQQHLKFITEMEEAKGGQIKKSQSKSEFSSKNGKRDSDPAAKKKSKSRICPSEDEKAADSKANVCKELRSMVQDAHTALTDLRSRNAEQAFSLALALLDTNTPKELGLSTLDELLLLYGRASALTEIGQSEELSEARKLLEKIKSFEERMFQCLVYYAFGKTYVKENRFALALEQFSDSLQMVKNQIMPGKLTWPLTKEIVKETQQDYFKEILESSIELCKFPPIPDAICRHEKCHGHLKTEIYFTDPDFKGFIEICCCQSCVIQYHITCWKTLKTSSFFEKNEKDFLQEPCLTPDCIGQICNIRIYGPTGLMKCKFEATIIKPPTPKKPRVNQKCTSVKKLKSKEMHRLKRKQHKQTFQDKQTIKDEILLHKDDSAAQSQHKAWLLYKDRVLLQISQNLELLREEKGLHVLTLISSLKPWLELDLSRGNQLAGTILNWQEEKLETLGQAVELLLQRKNRVWARVLIHLLASCLDTNPKINNWACQLNDAGLNAAKSFIERNAGHLEQMDLALLLNFGPLQEMIIERLGTRPELFSSIGLTVTEYLKQAPPHDMRLFIWTLEEHRDKYVSCHAILDDYFDMMDGHCSVLKKSENQNNSPMKTKSRGRKKKQKEPKGVIVWSGMGSVTPRDDWDQDFFEDDSLSFLHPSDPFSVPSHLREQVAEFEDQYNSTRHRNHFKNILDNNPDSTKETLYDYFAQILDEHGPLVAEDPLLVGEVKHFPPVAQQKIEEMGGFECFLLESLRFIKMGRCIGLAKHAVSLQQAGHGTRLDDLDDLEDPDTNSSPDLHADFDPEFTNYLNNYSSAQTEVYPILPNPYVFGAQPPPLVQSAIRGIDPSSHWTNSKCLDIQQHAAYLLSNGREDLDPHANEADVGVCETDPFSGGITSLTTKENFMKNHATVQTCPETMRSVAVNTEPHERFERCHGDINKQEKSNKELKQQIDEKANGCDQVNLKYKEELIIIEEDIQKITVNSQVTKKELVLFQQKLEEEVKKDQKEKKDNQEVLKSLKLEIEELVEEHGRLTQNIRENKHSYEAKLSDFLELGNQSAAEKMSLEDEIKHCKALFTTASGRSRTAQLLIEESSRDQGLYGLYRELADTKALLSKLDEAAHRFPSQDLEMTRNSWRAKVEEVEKKISSAESQHQEQMDQVKNGRRVSELLPGNNTKQPESSVKPSSGAAAHRTSPLTQLSAETLASPAPAQHKPPTRTPEPQHSTVFEKAMKRLTDMFPDYTRLDLMRFVQELRSSSGGSLNSMALQDVVGGVTQLILDHQEKLISAAKSNIVGRGSPAHCATPPLVTPAWQQLGPQRATHSNAVSPKSLR